MQIVQNKAYVRCLTGDGYRPIALSALILWVKISLKDFCSANGQDGVEGEISIKQQI